MGVGALAASGWHRAPGVQDTPRRLPATMPAKILTQGRHGNRHASAANASRHQSVVIALDVKTGTMHSEVLPIYSAHHVIVSEALERYVILPQDGELAAITAPNLSRTGFLQAPKGLAFGGHGHLSADGRLVYATMRDDENAKRDRSQPPQAFLAVYDLVSKELVAMHSTNGLGPHDMVFLADGKTLAIAHSGSLGYVRAQDKDALGYEADSDVLQHSPTQIRLPAEPSAEVTPFLPKIVLFDTETMQPVDELFSPHPIPMVHLTVDDAKTAYAVSNHYLPGTDALNEETLALVNRTFPERNWPMDVLEQQERVVVGLPITAYDFTTRRVSTHLLSVGDQRRSQSIAWLPRSRRVVAGFLFSNQLVVIEPDGAMHAIPASRYGISVPIGVSVVEGTGLFAVSGMYDDIALVDQDSMELVQRFSGHLYRSSHLTMSQV